MAELARGGRDGSLPHARELRTHGAVSATARSGHGSDVAYAGLRQREALALKSRHVRERTLLVVRAVSDGELEVLNSRRQPRTVPLLALLRQDLAEWRRASDSAPASPVFQDLAEWRRASDSAPASPVF